jgi:hypothetical protein
MTSAPRRSARRPFGEIAVHEAPPGAQLLGDVAATPGLGFDVVRTDDRNENRIGQIRGHTFLMDGSEGRAEGAASSAGRRWPPGEAAVRA